MLFSCMFPSRRQLRKCHAADLPSPRIGVSRAPECGKLFARLLSSHRKKSYHSDTISAAPTHRIISDPERLSVTRRSPSERNLLEQSHRLFPA